MEAQLASTASGISRNVERVTAFVLMCSRLVSLASGVAITNR